MASLLDFVGRRPITVLLVVALLTAGAVAAVYDFRAGRPRIRVDASADRLLPEANEARGSKWEVAVTSESGVRVDPSTISSGEFDVFFRKFARDSNRRPNQLVNAAVPNHVAVSGEFHGPRGWTGRVGVGRFVCNSHRPD